MNKVIVHGYPARPSFLLPLLLAIDMLYLLRFLFSFVFSTLPKWAFERCGRSQFSKWTLYVTKPSSSVASQLPAGSNHMPLSSSSLLPASTSRPFLFHFASASALLSVNIQIFGHAPHLLLAHNISLVLHISMCFLLTHLSCCSSYNCHSASLSPCL